MIRLILVAELEILFSFHSKQDIESCMGKTWPVKYSSRPHPAELVLEKILRAMSKPVYLLNITELSDLRIDGHPSIYGSGGHSSMDCSHWCLAGVPDTWNELFYAALVQN